MLHWVSIINNAILDPVRKIQKKLALVHSHPCIYVTVMLECAIWKLKFANNNIFTTAKNQQMNLSIGDETAVDFCTPITNSIIAINWYKIGQWHSLEMWHN